MSITRDESVIIAFGKHLQAIRTKKGIALRKLEGLAEIDFSEIHRIEKGQRNPSLTTLVALAKGLDIPLLELLDFDAQSDVTLKFKD